MSEKSKAEMIEELESGLPYFTGTTQYYRLYPNLMLTDGAKFLAETANCYWLMDIIASVQLIPEVKKESFQVYDLKVNEDGLAVVTCGDGNDNEVYRQDVETDFPLDHQRLYYTNDVVMLPSEY